MVWFIISWVTHSLLITLTHRQYNDIPVLHNYNSPLQSSSTTNFSWLSPAKNSLGNWLHTELVLNWLQIFPESRHRASTLTAQKTHLYCWLALTTQKTCHAAAIVMRWLTAPQMCLPLRCVATSEARRGYSFYCCVCSPAMSNKYLYFYCWVHVLRFLWLISSCFGQIRHNMYRQWGILLYINIKLKLQTNLNFKTYAHA
jgi:hypothetical protein